MTEKTNKPQPVGQMAFRMSIGPWGIDCRTDFHSALDSEAMDSELADKIGALIGYLLDGTLMHFGFDRLGQIVQVALDVINENRELEGFTVETWEPEGLDSGSPMGQVLADMTDSMLGLSSESGEVPEPAPLAIGNYLWDISGRHWVIIETNAFCAETGAPQIIVQAPQDSIRRE